MSPWNILLESLHSALIDELNERLPKEKPELGLPIRQAKTAWPSVEIEEVLCADARIETAQGVVFLGLSPGCAKILAVQTRKLWEKLLKRAERDFTRRGIAPALSPPSNWPRQESGPSLSKTIWIPFRVRGEACFLGLGV